MAEIAKPTNGLISFVNEVLDFLIKGLGADAAYTFAVTEVPLLAMPVVSTIFKWSLDRFASLLDSALKRNADIVVIRFQNDIRKAEYDKALEPIKKGSTSAQDLANAKAAIDALVNRNR